MEDGQGSFAAELFGATVPGGRLPGSLRRVAGAIVFEGPSLSIELPLEGLEARMGGFDDRTLFLSHPSSPGLEVTSLDPALVAALGDLPAVQRAHRRRLGGRSRFWGCAVAAGLGVLLLAVAGFFGWKLAVGAVVEQVSPELERSIGELAKSAAGLEDNQESADLAELAAPLVARSTSAEWRFFVVHDESVNAFALPGGVIAVFCGLLTELDEPALVGVLAHEIAHVEGRHGLRSMVSAVALRATLALLLGDTSGFEALLVSLGTDLADLSYSRELEEAADDRGAELLLEAGVGIQPLVQALESLARLETTSSMPAFLSSHPHPADRAERLALRLPAGVPLAERTTSPAFVRLRAGCANSED